MKVTIILKREANGEPLHFLLTDATDLKIGNGALEVTWYNGKRETTRGYPLSNISYYEVEKP